MSPAETAAYSLAPLTMWLRVTAGSADASATWSALTLMLWATFQFADVKVRVDGATDTSVPSWPLTVTVTSAIG